MTDLTTKDNKYYTVSQYNPTDANVNAQTNDVLLYPIIENASDYQVAISKARIDLSGIPLTTHNIPLKTYQVGLKNGNDEYTAYLRQLNAENKNYLYNVSAGGTYSKYVYLTGGTTTPVNLPNAIPISSVLTNVFQFVETDYQNVFVVGSTDNSQNYNTLVGFSFGGTVIYQNTFSSIQAMCLDRQSNLYLAIESGSGSAIEVYHLLETSNPIGFNLIQTITQDANGSPLSQVQTICAEGQLIVGSGANTITIYDVISWNPITTYNEASITQLGNSSAILSGYDRFCVEDKGNVPDLLVGVPVGSNTMTNAITGGTFVSGSWLTTANQAIWAGSGANGYCFGVGSGSGYTYAYTYDYQTGVSTAPFLANGSLGMKTVFKGSQLNTVLGLAGGTTGALVGFNLNQQNPPNNSWSVIDRTLFPANSQAPISVDTQQNTQKLVMVGTDNNLYQTSTPFAPKVFYNFHTTQVGAVKEIAVAQQGVGFNGTGNTAYTVPQNNFTLYSSSQYAPIPWKFTKAGNKGWLLLERNTYPAGTFHSLLIQPYSLPTFVDFSADFNISGIYNTNPAYTNQFDMTYSTAGNFLSVMNSVLGVSQDIYQYDATTGTLISTITVPTIANNVGMLATVNAGGIQILVATSDMSIYFYNMNNPASPVLLGSTTFVQGSATIMGGVQWVSTTGGNYLAITVDGNGDGIINSLYACLLNGSYGIQSYFLIDNTRVYYNGSAFGSQIGVNPDIDGTEISVLGAQNNSSTISGQVFLYNCYDSNTWQLVSQFTGSQGIGSEVIYYSGDIDYTYAIQPITQNGTPIAVSNIAFSQNNPNLLYATNTSGVVYSGDLAGGSITFSAYTPLAGGTFDSINAVVPSPNTFDWYVRNFGISGQTPHGSFHYDAVPVYGVAKNAISGEFLVSAGGTLTSYAPTGFTSNWTNSTITGLNLIYAKNGEDINAGDANIYDFQTLIDAINVAFEEAFTKAPSGVFTQAPSVSLNFNNGLATLTYSSDYSTLPKGILMNSALHQLLYFFSVKDDFNPNFYRVVLTPTSTSLTQTSKSLYLFNQLDKILFISNTIFVFGSYFGANNTNNIITDIDVPTNSDGYMNNLGQVVYYQPTFLRPFILSSNIPLSRIQMEVWYSTLDGEQYQLQLVPDGNWNAKLIFPRRY